MFTSTHEGVKFDQTVFKDLAAQSTQLIGFLKASEFSVLFFTERDAVAVRIYEGLDGKAIAVPITHEGMELANRVQSRGPVADGTINALRTSAKDGFSNAISGQPTSAVFSKTMINSRLPNADNDIVADGLAFYKLSDVALSPGQNDKHFTAPSIMRWKHEFKNELNTFVAVPVTLDATGMVPSNALSTAKNGVLSDRPCPGFCVVIETSEVRSRSMEETSVIETIAIAEYPVGASATRDGRKPYLRPWNKPKES